MPLRILIADDDARVRRQVSGLLSSRPEWQICGEAADGVDAIKQAKLLNPDLVILDISMPHTNGLDASRHIRKQAPHTKILIVSQHDKSLMLNAALEAGADGYVTKSQAPHELLPTLDAVIHDEVAARLPAGPLAEGAGENGRDAKLNCLLGGGEMGALMRALAWSNTPLGTVETWPQSLRTAISLMLESRFAMVVAWGPEFRFFYNDRYRPVLGASKHPGALGTPAKQVFPEAWPFIGPLFESTRRGESVGLDDVLIPLERYGYLENCYFSLSYSPIRDESGGVGGMLAVVAETTERVQGERRLKTLRDLARRAPEAKTRTQAYSNAAVTLSENPIDVPFALLYRVENDGSHAKLEAAAGLAGGAEASPSQVDLTQADTIGWPLRHALESGQLTVVDDLQARFGVLPGGPYPEPAQTAVLMPLLRPGQPHGDGILVFGVSPRRALDEAYRGFYELAADHVLTAVRNAVAHEEEQQRVERLEELDKAKTVFFSNVSHEFRTPLTLILGPLEETLAQAGDRIPQDQREKLATVYRNSLRLLKLVNSLLDFSRIEAGRVQAVYQPTELATFTVDLASLFRSAMEKAGLNFQVACPPLPEPIYVDRDMWEKILLNLLSNALKYTLQGKVSVRLEAVGKTVELSVEDTGTGIPEDEVPHLFERFHRVVGAQGRTYEGTGIGLALVNELAKLHGGSVRAESTEGKGSRFVVSIPQGSAHLPPERIQEHSAESPSILGAKPYLEEALGWLPELVTAQLPGQSSQPEILPRNQDQAHHSALAGAVLRRILVADDNADMRNYMRRLLGDRYEVVTVADGEAALASAQKHPPDLILADVMMPRLDGLGLLRAVRSDPVLRGKPVILVSARAGEEPVVEGLAAGADDYLAKPFRAHELMARVAAHLAMSRVREEAEDRLRASESRFRLAQAAAQIGTWEWDADRNLSSLSAELHEMFGTDPVDTNSRETWAGRVHPEDWEQVKAQMEVARGDGSMEFDYRYQHPEKGLRWFYCKGRRFSRRGNTGRMFGVVLDVTQRKQTEEALHRVYEELEVRVKERTSELERKNAEAAAQAELLDLVNDAIFVRTTDGRITYWNRGAERLYGWSKAEVLGRTPHEILHTEFPVPFSEIASEVQREGRWIGELGQLRRDGHPIIVASRWTLWSNAEGKQLGYLELNTDITEQRRAEDSLRALTGRLLQMQDEERRRIARELHDSAGQLLVALGMNLAAIEKETLSSKGVKACQDGIDLVQEMSKELRTMSHLLHPPLLDEAGLSSAVRWYVEGFAERSKIPVSLELSPNLGRLSRELETAIFRIVQEGLTNIHRHSGSATAGIKVTLQPNEVRVEVQDRGRGMPARSPRGVTGPFKPGVGIQGMRERVRQLGGRLQIESTPNGTTVLATLPVSSGPEESRLIANVAP